MASAKAPKPGERKPKVHQDPKPGQLMLTYRQAWERLGVSQSQFYRMLRNGEIHSLPLGKQVRRISAAEIQAYVDRLEAEAKAEQHGGSQVA